MQKITITGTELVTVIKYLYPDLKAPIDFACEKSSDNDDLFLDWKTETYPMPTDAELNANLAAATKAQEDSIAAIKAQKDAAESKLAALGLTTDDLKALGLGSN